MTVRQPERKEAAESDGDRSQKAYKAHLEQKNYFTMIRWPPRSEVYVGRGRIRLGTRSHGPKEVDRCLTTTLE